MPTAHRLLLTCSCGAKISHVVKNAIRANCAACGGAVFEIVEVPWVGFVYVLSNASIPDLYKVGFTTTSPEQRASELSDHTGVPTKYKVEAHFLSADPPAHERDIHLSLERYRSSRNREFFRVPLREAVAHCRRVTGFDPEGTDPRWAEKDYDPWAEFRSLNRPAQSIISLPMNGKYACPRCNAPMRPPRKEVQARGGHRWCPRCIVIVDKAGAALTD